jgi:SAM-dependent methyltransferase
MTDSEPAKETEELKNWLRSLVSFPETGILVDLGSGSGDDVARLAREYPATRLIGLDVVPPSPENKSAAGFAVADLSGPFPLGAESVDALFSVNLIECIPDKTGFINECARVLKPNGTILLAHFDWDTQTFDGVDRAPVRKILHAFNDWQQAWMKDIDPWAGRRLCRYAQESGAFKGQIHAYTLISTSFEPGSYARNQADSFGALARRGVIEEREYTDFMDFQHSLAARNAFFYSVTMFAFVGTKN